MSITLTSRWLSLTARIAFCAAAVALVAQASTKESTRAELTRLQNQSGLTLISFEGSGPDGPVYVVAFASRSLPERKLLKEKNGGVRAISPDGTRIAFEGRRNTGQSSDSQYRTFLGITRRDGSDTREYPDLDEPYGLCWSPDGSALALKVKNLKRGKDAAYSLQILNLRDGITEEVDAKGYVTSQCWSPDSKQIAYQAGGTLRLYDTQTKQSHALTNGQHATWSPDGKWIAFLEDGDYYTVRPPGSEKKQRFKKKDALTPLWWSPDSRFVAYISRNGFFEGHWWPPIEQGRLRVRRLDDNAEDWVANLYIEGHVPSFQWVKDVTLSSHSEEPY